MIGKGQEMYTFYEWPQLRKYMPTVQRLCFKDIFRKVESTVYIFILFSVLNDEVREKTCISFF